VCEGGDRGGDHSKKEGPGTQLRRGGRSFFRLSKSRPVDATQRLLRGKHAKKVSWVRNNSRVGSAEKGEEKVVQGTTSSKRKVPLQTSPIEGGGKRSARQGGPERGE